MIEIRCKTLVRLKSGRTIRCGQYLGEMALIQGFVSIRCSKCGQKYELEVIPVAERPLLAVG